MIVAMIANATPEQIEHISQRIRDFGYVLFYRLFR